MLFRFFRPDDALVRELRVAIACHRPTVLHQLLASHGSRAFANALADLSGRVIADALSMLAAAQGHQVLKHLPHAAPPHARGTGPRVPRWVRRRPGAANLAPRARALGPARGRPAAPGAASPQPAAVPRPSALPLIDPLATPGPGVLAAPGLNAPITCVLHEITP